ncbi:MAG: DAK2 domain-containing protein, partial [Spirochaetales bacterium]|nr:DAK2 domain-containing protein [Spirochaetales bacterium]
DALHPAVEALSRAAEEGVSLAAALDEASRASRRGAEATQSMVAKRGRAKYLGDTSAGHQDAGATSCWLIIDAFARSVGGTEEEQ